MQNPGISNVGIIGLGRMGHVLANLLMAGGVHVIAYDLDPNKVQRVANDGATPASAIRDFSSCDVVLTYCLMTMQSGQLCYPSRAWLLSCGPVEIHLSASTIGAEFCRELDAAHRARGQTLFAIPVLGNPELAAHRGLFILLGGPTDAIARCRAVIELLGQTSFFQSMGEAFAFLSKAGVPPEKAQEILTGSLFDGRVHKAYSGKIVEHRYTTPGMTVPLAAKDLRLLLAEAERSKVPMPLASLLHDRLVAVEARGWSDLDWSALGRLAAFEARLPDG